MAGRCRSGGDLSGNIHAVNWSNGKALCGKALCGKAPQGKSAGWGEWDKEYPTCPRCLKKLDAPPTPAEGERVMMDIQKIRCTVPCKVENAESGCECAEARDEITRLRSALLAFADHFGPLEDNHMLHPEARKCFALARAALGDKP